MKQFYEQLNGKPNESNLRYESHFLHGILREGKDDNLVKLVNETENAVNTGKKAAAVAAVGNLKKHVTENYGGDQKPAEGQPVTEQKPADGSGNPANGSQPSDGAAQPAAGEQGGTEQKPADGSQAQPAANGGAETSKSIIQKSGPQLKNAAVALSGAAVDVSKSGISKDQVALLDKFVQALKGEIQ